MNIKKLSKAFSLLLALSMLLPAIPALAHSEEDVRVIVIDPKKLTLAEGDSYQFAVAAKDGGSLPELQWVSDAPEVAIVDEDGKVTALKEGRAKVTVSSVDGTTDTSTCRVTVEEREDGGGSSVRIIVAEPKKLTLTEEETYQLTVAAKDGGQLPKLQWVSDDPEVATVDQNGKVTALKEGKAKIVVTSADGTTDASSCRVTVEELEITPIKATLEGNIYNANYQRVSSATEKAIRDYCERLGDSRVDKTLRKAVEKVGTPYGKMDCSELTRYAYKYMGMSLPRVSDDQAKEMAEYRREGGKPQVGDLCFMKFPSVVKCSCGDSCRRYQLIHHAALYLGEIDGRTYVVDSSSAIGNVIIREFSNNTIAGMPVVFYAGK